MRLVNTTRYPAMLLTGVLNEERMTASVIARITYELRGGRLVPGAEQPYIVSAEPWESPQGPFEQDQVFKTGGVDLFLFGKSYAPSRRPTIVTVVSVQVGDFRREVRVYGRRRWTRSGGRLVPSSPEPFVEVPLTPDRAFGGRSTWDQLEVPWPDNPEGTGFYLSKEEAEGSPLPQLEDPEQLIERWDDRPDPAGFGMCPLTSGPRLKAAVVLDQEGKLEAITPRMFNRAFPAMVAPRVDAGAQVTIRGVSPKGAVEFRLPESLPQARLQLGERVFDRPLEIEQVGVDAEAALVFVTYRFPFRYGFVPEQQRSITITYAEEESHALRPD